MIAGASILFIVGTTAGIALGWGVYQACKWADHKFDNVETESLEEIEKQKEKEKRPKYNGKELGTDPSKCPAEGFEWKGRGRPETGKGSWVKDLDLPTQESLHPDLQHPPPKAPHWDYTGPDGKVRLNIDGTWEWKEV